jgi:hypothetical protein
MILVGGRASLSYEYYFRSLYCAEEHSRVIKIRVYILSRHPYKKFSLALLISSVSTRKGREIPIILNFIVKIMDPLSIITGAIALVQTADLVATRLIDIWGAYDAAPREMTEIAQEMTLSAGLIERFAKSIKEDEKIPKNFHQAVLNLVEKVRRYHFVREVRNEFGVT